MNAISKLLKLGQYPQLKEERLTPKSFEKSPLKILKNIISPSVDEVKAHNIVDKNCWPAPSPYGPGQLPPTVLNVSEAEKLHFLDTVVNRYIKTLRNHSLKSIGQSYFHAKMQLMSNDEFNEFFGNTSFSRFLTQKFDTVDLNIFSPYMMDGKTYYKVDLAPAGNMERLKGLELEASKTLFEQTDEGLKVVAIQITDLVLTPKDKDFDLAKLFVLQAANNLMLICEHPKRHFPMDSICGVSKYILNKDGLIYKMLEPHMYMQLPLNFAVLYISKSVAHNDQNEIYTPFPCTKEGFLESMKSSYRGIKGNSAYPSYRFSLEPEKIYGEYGEFLEGYWWTIYDFVCSVVQNCQKDADDVIIWADSISSMLPGFPNGEEILEGDKLERALTTYIYTVSVAHAADHQQYDEQSILKIPTRLRVKPPSKTNRHANWKLDDCVTGEDIFRYDVANEMYFKPNNIRTMLEVNYNFPLQLKVLENSFKRSLLIYERNLKVKNFITLKNIACSIQY